MGGKKPLRRPLWPPTRATASNYYPLGLDGAGGAAKPLLRAPKKPAPLHGRLPAFSGAVDAFERARKCFLEWRYFFSIILSEFLKNRVALQLDRKLRIVNENTEDYDDWLKWTLRAFEACYGYEYQGDNVLIARINLLLTFTDYYEERWERRPDDKLLRQMANKIAWNIWQMDGLKDTVPLGKPYEEFRQITLFDMFGDMGDEKDDEPEAVPCRIFDWRSKNSILFKKLKEM